MSIKSLLGLIGGACFAISSIGCTGLACPGSSTTKTPTPVPTSSTPVATATPAVVTLASGSFNVTWRAAAYAAASATDQVVNFVPATGKAVTVKATGARTDDRLSIDVAPAACVTGAGLYTTAGVANSNTTTLSFTPPNAGNLIVNLGLFNAVTNTNSVAVVTVTQ